MASGCRALLLDIEGTTTSISFVKDTLFPYVRQQLDSFLKDNWTTSQVEHVVASLKVQNVEDIKDGLTDHEMLVGSGGGNVEEVRASILANVLWQMDNDRKTGALKQLQGLIFKDAYQQGYLKGHVYDDVPPAFKRWTETMDKRVYIYSSGSVEAQKLLFGYSQHGNLCPYISGYFDTTVGPKVVSQSYTKISAQIKLEPEEILFVTDIPKEAHAAQKAGLKVRLSIRPGNGDLSEDDVNIFTSINSFDELSN